LPRRGALAARASFADSAKETFSFCEKKKVSLDSEKEKGFQWTLRSVERAATRTGSLLYFVTVASAMGTKLGRGLGGFNINKKYLLLLYVSGKIHWSKI
jgi:hypothetical protein